MIARREDFPLLASSPDLHYLDSAATSQKPRAVLDAMTHYYTHDNANPHRGAYALSARATERYHDARARIAKFVGVRDSVRLIFTRGTTESLNLVATAWGRANVHTGDEIVVTGLEHHANFVPWQQLALGVGAKLRVCQLTNDGGVDLDHLAAIVGSRTKVVAFNHVRTRSARSIPSPRCSPLHGAGAIALISATGLIVPSAFDTWLNATTFVRGPTSAARWSRSTPPSLVSWQTRNWLRRRARAAARGRSSRDARAP